MKSKLYYRKGLTGFTLSDGEYMNSFEDKYLEVRECDEKEYLFEFPLEDEKFESVKEYVTPILESVNVGESESIFLLSSTLNKRVVITRSDGSIRLIITFYGGHDGFPLSVKIENSLNLIASINPTMEMKLLKITPMTIDEYEKLMKSFKDKLIKV